MDRLERTKRTQGIESRPSGVSHLGHFRPAPGTQAAHSGHRAASRWGRRFAAALLPLAFAGGEKVALSQTTWYVDVANCPDNGSGTQNDLFCTISDAITAASSGDTIEVADGTYDDTYSGVGSNKDLEITNKNLTIESENGPSTCIIDCENDGRAFYLYDGPLDVTIQGLTIRNGDRADEGGGIRTEDADVSLMLVDCLIENCVATHGGGISIRDESEVVIQNCTFTGNTCGGGGGAIDVYNDAVAELIALLIEGNGAGDDDTTNGGGVHVYEASVVVSGCVIEGNAATSQGGGMYFRSLDVADTLSLSDTIVTDNESGDQGGGLYLLTPVAAIESTIIRCSFTVNEAVTKGGGVRIEGVHAENHPAVPMTNCLIDNNLVTGNGGKGGGVYIYKSEVPFVNCTIARNTISGTSPLGGAIYIDGFDEGNDIDLLNSIVWQNTVDGNGNQIETSDGDTMIVATFSDFDFNEDQVDGDETGGNIDNEDPIFADWDVGDYRLSRGSPCLDTGKTSDCSGDCDDGDLVGSDRIVNHVCSANAGEGNIDMGCLESFGGVVYVDTDASGDDDGSSWADAYTDLQDAMTKPNVASPDYDPATCEIWVAEGSYKPDQCTSCSGNRTSTFTLVEGVSVYGGFDGTETAKNQRDPQDNETILTGLIGSPGLTRVYHVVTASDTITEATEFDGFTVKLGRADGGGTDQDKGAGLYIQGSPTLKQLIVSDNLGDHGAGVYIKSGNPSFTDCAFVDNDATDAGGGVGTGGAVNIGSGGSGNIEFLRCNFNNNLALDKGGGVYTDSTGAEPHFTNCLFYRNDANKSDTDTRGGAIYTNRKIVLLQCTFAKNWCGEENMGGAIYNAAGDSILKNCVLWKNYSTSSEYHDSEDDQIKIAGGTVTASYTSIENIGSLGGGQNNGQNPKFQNFSQDDYDLDPVNCGDDTCDTKSIDRGDDDDCTGVCDTGGGGDSGGDVKKRTRKVNLDNRSDLIDRGALERPSGS